MTKQQTKQLKSAVAIVLSALLITTGTMAWQSISQEATNEVYGTVNPGGRLHSDFNGEDTDIYVENFTDEKEGVDIFVRVRIEQYMEFGEDAGNKHITGTRDARNLIQDTSIDDKTGWISYFGEYDSNKEQYIGDYRDTRTDLCKNYWTWTLGGEENKEKKYMPTFNKNKDSLLADINGSWEGYDWNDPFETGDTTDKYNDYVNWNKTDTAEGFEVWDNDRNNADELAANENGEQIIKSIIARSDDSAYGSNTKVQTQDIIDTNKLTKNIRIKTNESGEKIKHSTQTAEKTMKVITMAEWKKDGSKEGNYWVVDVDGWCYWATAIKPNTATGLLVDGIKLTGAVDESWYYAINTTAQFITAGDSGKAENPQTGFWSDPNDCPTEDAEKLLENIGVDLTAASDDYEAQQREALQSLADKFDAGEDVKDIAIEIDNESYIFDSLSEDKSTLTLKQVEDRDKKVQYDLKNKKFLTDTEKEKSKKQT